MFHLQGHSLVNMSLLIESKINRHTDYSSIVEFHVTASKDIDDFGNVYDIVAELSGAFTHVPLMGSINERYHNIYRESIHFDYKKCYLAG